MPLRARGGASTWRLRKHRPLPASRETTRWSPGSAAKSWATENVHHDSAAPELQGNPKPGHEAPPAPSLSRLHGASKKAAKHRLHPCSNCQEPPYLWSSQRPPTPPPAAPTIGAPQRVKRPPGSTGSGRKDPAPSSRHDADDQQLADTKL